MEALRWPRAPEAYRPDYSRCLTGVYPTVYRLLGHDPGARGDLLSILPKASPRQAQRAFVLCLDGFGFKELAGAERFRAVYPRYGTWITSVYPTITSCALTSLYQALPPGRHGILGHYVWKEFPGAIVDMLRMQADGAETSLAAAGFDVRRWQREPGQLDGTGPRGSQFLHFSIVNSDLSTFCYGKAELGGFQETLEGFTKAARRLEESPHGWVGLYLATIDSLSHAVTGDSPQVSIAVRQIEQALAWMVSILPRGVAEETALFVVADHGQNTLRSIGRWNAPQRDQLWERARAVGASGRTMHFYAKPGQRASLLGWLRDSFAEAADVFEYEEIAELTGPGRDDEWVRQSLGDAVAVFRSGFHWEKDGLLRKIKKYETELVSQHGALTWDEMFVPMICAPLSAFAGE